MYCKGRRSHGFWNAEELELHINVLELRAAFFGLKCFANDKSQCSSLLRIDNTTAIAYIRRMRDSRYKGLGALTKEIWQWSERREIWISAAYIRSSENVEADQESRRLQPETEFQISDGAFRKIVRKFGYPQIDLFASRANAKCQRYVSWQRDPDSIGIDAFTLSWKRWFFYAFPPFSVILRMLRKIERQGSTGIVVVPYWKAQPWFPIFLSLLADEPIVFQPNINLIRSSCREEHRLCERLSLVAAKLTGKRLSGERYHWNQSKY